MKKLMLAGLLSMALLGAYAVTAVAITLPDPPGVVGGIGTALPYDDFWSYSGAILAEIQQETPELLPEAIYGDFSFSTGTGTLDVLLYTGSQGANNQNVGPGDAFDFEDPAVNQGGGTTTYEGFWGRGDQANGPVTVGQVLDYLHAFDPQNNIPVFMMDLNQTGSNPELSFVGEVLLLDPDTMDPVHLWAFDHTTQAGDGAFDVDSLVWTAGLIDLPEPYDDVNLSLGSGRIDFIAFAPTMDLSGYDENLLFVSHFKMGNLNDGFEEIYLTGRYSVNDTVIPEPGTMLLLGSGLLALGFYGRRRFTR